MSKPDILVGIDEGLQQLDVAIPGQDTASQVPHDAAGLTELCARLTAAPPVQTVMETTGGLEPEVAVELNTATQVVVLVSLRQVQNFARHRSIGQDRGVGCAIAVPPFRHDSPASTASV